MNCKHRLRAKRVSRAKRRQKPLSLSKSSAISISSWNFQLLFVWLKFCAFFSFFCVWLLHCLFVCSFFKQIQKLCFFIRLISASRLNSRSSSAHFPAAIFSISRFHVCRDKKQVDSNRLDGRQYLAVSKLLIEAMKKTQSSSLRIENNERF